IHQREDGGGVPLLQDSQIEIGAERGSEHLRTYCTRTRHPKNGHTCGAQIPASQQLGSGSRIADTIGTIQMGRVLIADDQRDVLEALYLLLKGEGFEIESASSPAGILGALETREFDVVLMDLNYTRDTTSGQEGLDLLAKIQGSDPSLPGVVMTAWGSVDIA